MNRNVMWNGTCRYQDFESQLKTTRLSGCDVLTMTPLDFHGLVASGLSPSDMLHMAADAGVELSHLDPLFTWAPEWRPDDVPAEFMPFFETTTDEFLQIAETLGCTSMTVVCSAPPGSIKPEQLMAPFAELCSRAAGLRVDLEFIPVWGLPDLASACEIVREVDAPNGGLTFDFWHFFRGGPDFALLESIPAEKIHAVQVCDAPMTRGEGRTALQDMMDDRLPLGMGEFRVQEVLELLAHKGALNFVGPEYYSDRMEGLSSEEIASVIDDTYWSRLTPLGVSRSA